MGHQSSIVDKDLLYIKEIANFSFVSEILFQTVYIKLFTDGYVYCKDGLFQTNKDSLKKQLQTSIFKTVLDDKNPSSFSDVLACFSKINLTSEGHAPFTNAECQSILYILLAPASKELYSTVLLTILQHLYPQSDKYITKDESFIVRNDIELIQISSVERFISEISKISETQNHFFRGHSNINYISVPSLFRESRLYKNEYMMYQELVIRCPDSFVHCTSHLDFLVEMQHYGLPTRLLDVTSNPLVALYFACERGNIPGEVLIYEVCSSDLKYEKCEEVAILSSLPMLTFSKQQTLLSILRGGSRLLCSAYEEFRHEVLSECPSFCGDISFQEVANPVFVKPIRKNQRIAHQEGAFIIWGLDESFYNNQEVTYGQQSTKDYRYICNGKKLVFYIPADKKGRILEILNRIGINKAYVYPEIDDVAEYIKSRVTET